MVIDRRRLLAASAFAGIAPAAMATPAPAAPLTRLGVDAAQLGIRPDPAADQTRALQQAIDQLAATRAPLALGPGIYRAGHLKLPSGAQIVGIRGATRIVFAGGPSLFSAQDADYVSLSGLLLDGAGRPLPKDRGLVQLSKGNGMRIVDCDIIAAGGHGIALQSVDGAVSGNTIVGAENAAIFSLDARGLAISGNTIRDAGNNGIQIFRWDGKDDGTLVSDNRIENTRNRSGGSGQYGNAINVHRAANVLVRGNRIKTAAFSAVRGNGASNIQIVGNTATDLGEVALYAEFGFEGAVIANNTVDGAALGAVVTNFKEGGRLAVVQGNLIRNLKAKRPAGTDPNDGAGIGIAVEADSAITGNVIENAPTAGLWLGWGNYFRDVTATGNIIRNADVGIAVSVLPGAGNAVIAGNLIAGAVRGAIVGMEWEKPVSGDLGKEGAGRYAQLVVSGNRVR
jgi:uncharacterized secreted repeat protein (TIGR03808 family)